MLGKNCLIKNSENSSHKHPCTPAHTHAYLPTPKQTGAHPHIPKAVPTLHIPVHTPHITVHGLNLKNNIK